MTTAPRALLQVVPELPPAIGGVGDYALGLARKLRERHGTETTFLVAREHAGRGDELEGFPVIEIGAQESAAFARVLTNAANGTRGVLVQYVGYGFDRNGAPEWLVDGLHQWRRSGPARRLVTMFHELYADSWPWRRAFWYSRRQRRLAMELARMSDSCATSLQFAAQILSGWRADSAVSAAPIPSGIGEPATVPPLSEREPRMAVFGTRGSRERAYGLSGRELARSCELLGIRELVDVGPGEIDGIALPASVRLRRLGVLEPDRVGSLLLGCRAGFLNHPAQYLAKSSVFAAYCAYGTVPVLAKAGPAGKDGLVAARHYWHTTSGGMASESLQTIASAAREWYLDHDQEKIALMFSQMLASSSPPA